MATTSPRPLRIVLTGASTAVAYAAVFRLAAGHCTAGTPLELVLVDTPSQLGAAQGTAMELRDCAFPALRTVTCTSDARTAMAQADVVCLLSDGPVEDRAKAVAANAHAVQPWVGALRHAGNVVVSGPAAPAMATALLHIEAVDRFTISAVTCEAVLRLRRELAGRLRCHASDIAGFVSWGNTSRTAFVDTADATLRGVPLARWVDESLTVTTLLPRNAHRAHITHVARRGEPAAVHASALVEHLRGLLTESYAGRVFSAGVATRGMYGIPDDIVCGLPVIVEPTIPAPGGTAAHYVSAPTHSLTALQAYYIGQSAAEIAYEAKRANLTG